MQRIAHHILLAKLDECGTWVKKNDDTPAQVNADEVTKSEEQARLKKEQTGSAEADALATKEVSGCTHAFCVVLELGASQGVVS